jgi:hypothetical protein
MTGPRRRQVWVAAAALVAALGTDRIAAGCPGSQILDATFNYLVSNPNWGGIAGGNGSCGTYGCYESQSGPPVSPGMRGVFWALGSGNPIVGLGNDSGIFTGGFTANDFWLKQVSATFYPGGLYHFAAWVSLKLGPSYTVGPPVTWSAPDADGCGPSGNPPAQVCTCFLLTDQWNNEGYFATLSARSDVLGNTRFDPGQTIRLAPIPRPVIVATSAGPDGGGPQILVAVRPSIALTDTGGVYQQDSCGTCLAAYHVFGARVPRGTLPQPGTQFVDLPRANGSAQGDTPLGSLADVRLDCDQLREEDMYLALELIGEGATPFRTGVLGRLSTRISCGANLAAPERGRDRGSRGDRGRTQR